MADYNKGDAFPIELAYLVNGVPIEEAELDEIEVTIGGRRFTLTDEDIAINPVTGKYTLFLTQELTFKLGGAAHYQVRFRKGTAVGSTSIDLMKIGATLSTTVI